MATNVSRRLAARGAPMCEVDCVNERLVEELKPRLNRLQGAARLFKALADDTRLKVIYALSQAELCVCDVAALINSTKATASYPLRLLYNMGLADYRRDGKLVYYRLTDEYLGRLVHGLVHREESQLDSLKQAPLKKVSL